MLYALTLFASLAHADAPDVAKGIQIHLERTVDASADRAWSFLGDDFAQMGTWAEGLESRALLHEEVPDGIAADPDAPVPGRMVDDGRREQVQVLVDFDAAARSFTFQAGNPPGVLAYAHNQHTIVDLGDGRSRVELDIVLVPKGIATLLKGKLQRKFSAYMEAYLDEAVAGLTGADQ